MTNTKRGRLIIRNLPFSVTEESLKSYFSPYGEIQEINILKRPNGKLLGCCFIQYVHKQSAAKAIHYVNGKPFMDRTIIVDWAIPKEKFKNLSNNVLEKKSNDSIAKLFDNKSSEAEKNCDLIDHSTEIENEGTIDKFDDSNSDNTSINNFKLKKNRVSCDISEGKTIFLKNVPFNITNDELKECVEQIGPIYYAVICEDPLTQHSRGTAFVKFKDRNHALKCLETNEKLKLKGSTLQAFPALEKNKLENSKQNQNSCKKKNSRNLYLLREGAIVAGSVAAQNVSMSDMQKRLELELWKSNMLKNLNMFVSDVRLIIHNLPLTFSDNQLRSLFKKYAPPKAYIIEAKVMRNLRKLDLDGYPVSKGYGFVTFREHEHALAALRTINNNPTIFSENKRPIVAFSIENRTVMTIKQKRIEKSRINNPLCPNSKKLKIDRQNYKVKKLKRSKDIPTFAGVETHPGQQTSRISNRKIMYQRELHAQNVLLRKKEMKKKKETIRHRNEKKECKVKSKIKRKLDHEKQFSQLVNKYKQQISTNTSSKKWYEGKE